MKKYVRYAMLGLAIFALALLAGCGSETAGKGTADGSSRVICHPGGERTGSHVLEPGRREEAAEAHDQGLLPR